MSATSCWRAPRAISETLDRAQALLELGYDKVDDEVARATLSVLLKHRTDLTKAMSHLEVPAS